MPFPPNRRELKLEGYDYHGQKTCPCGQTIELWHTPNDKTMPMDPMPDDESPAVSHWATCVKAQQFRRNSPAKVASNLPVNQAQSERRGQGEAQPTRHMRN